MENKTWREFGAVRSAFERMGFYMEARAFHRKEETEGPPLRKAGGWKEREHLVMDLRRAAGVRLVDMNPSLKMALVRFEAEVPGAYGLHLLAGMDESHLFVTPVTHGPTVRSALAALAPREVLAARLNGLKVRRQGDWFFIPSLPPKRAKLEADYPLPPDGRHRAEQAALDVAHARRVWRQGAWVESPDCWARGAITHPEHRTIRLDDWHEAQPNTAHAEARTSLRWTD